MDVRSILLDRIQALRQELDRAKRAVEQINPKWGDPIRGDLLSEFKGKRDDLKNLAQAVRKAQSDAALSQSWKSFQKTREECKPLFEECLALAQGSLVRTAGLDEGLCEIADALLHDFSNRIASISWDRFTVLGTEEFFRKLAQVIRVRFPEASIWSLPVAAHEFGHFVAPLLKAEDRTGTEFWPVKAVLERLERQESLRDRFYVEELFADLFATYVLGPAYPCTCMLLRWDPWTAHMDGDEHPSDAKRVYWILKVLEEMDENKGGLRPTYERIITKLRQSWRSSLKLIGQPQSLEEYLAAEENGGDIMQQLDEWFRELYGAVAENKKMADVRFRERHWIQAQRMSDEMRERAPLVARDEHTLAVVLNAAWWCRTEYAVRDASLLHWIGQQAVNLCRQIADRMRADSN